MGTDKKTIKSYDNYAEKWAHRVRSGENLAHDYIEKPAMLKILNRINIKGKNVLCIGCGTGEECIYLKGLGVNNVIGTDISSGLIDYARKSYTDIQFQTMDMEKLEFEEETFDIVYSSLTLHYVEDWTKTLENVYKVLKKGGYFLFSTSHPVRWSAYSKTENDRYRYLLGYEKYFDGNVTVYGDYLNIRKIDDKWYGDFDVSYYSKPISKMFNEITASQFSMVDFIEPTPVPLGENPSETAKKKYTAFQEIHSKIPLFIIFNLKK